MNLAARCASLSPPLRRATALLVLPLLFIMLASVVLLPIHQAWQSQERWREQTKQLLSEAAQAPALKEQIERQVQAVRSSQLRSKFYPAGGSMSAGAMVQGDIDALMASVQANSRTLAPIPVSEVSSLLRHGVRISASLRINQLQDLLNGLAQHPRLLRVEQLTVVAPQVQLPEENPPLAVSMDIYGYAEAASEATG